MRTTELLAGFKACIKRHPEAEVAGWTQEAGWRLSRRKRVVGAGKWPGCVDGLAGRVDWLVQQRSGHDGWATYKLNSLWVPFGLARPDPVTLWHPPVVPCRTLSHAGPHTDLAGICPLCHAEAHWPSRCRAVVH